MQWKGRVALCLKMSMFGDERQLCNRRRVNYYPSVTLRQRDMFAVDPTNALFGAKSPRCRRVLKPQQTNSSV